MSVKKKSVGRPKKKIKELPKKYLTCNALGVIMNEDGTYSLARLKFHPETKQAFVASIEDLADAHYKADFEIKKMLAHGDFIPKEPFKKESE